MGDQIAVYDTCVPRGKNSLYTVIMKQFKTGTNPRL